MPSHWSGLERCLGSYFYCHRVLAWSRTGAEAHLLREEVVIACQESGKQGERERAEQGGTWSSADRVQILVLSSNCGVTFGDIFNFSAPRCANL